MAYCTVSGVKTVLRIRADDLRFGAELEACVASADALVDGFLAREDLSVPSPVPQLVADASAHYAAWLFRRRRDPDGAEAFWAEAERLLTTYIAAETAEGEPAFKVASA